MPLSGFLFDFSPKIQNQKPATCHQIHCTARHSFLHSSFGKVRCSSFWVGRLDSHRTKVFCAVFAGAVRSCLISGKVEGKDSALHDTDYCILQAWPPCSRLEVYERKCEFRNIARVLLQVLCFCLFFFVQILWEMMQASRYWIGEIMWTKKNPTIPFPWGCDWL